MCVLLLNLQEDTKSFSCYNIEGKKEFTFIQNRTRKKKEKRMTVIHTETQAPVEESIETPLYK